MKRMIGLILLLSLLVCMSSCGGKALYSNDYYNIVSIDGQYQVLFTDKLSKELGKKADSTTLMCEYIDYPEFSGVREMCDAIKQGAIDAKDLKGLHKLYEIRNHTLEMFDIENPMDAVLPEDVQIKHVAWAGKYCYFPLETDISAVASLYWYKEDQMEEVFEAKYENALNEYQVILGTTNIPDRNAVEIRYNNETGWYKLLRYEIVEKDRKLYIQEHYTLDRAESAPSYNGTISGEIPNQVEIFGFGEEACFYAGFLYLDERPSVEWLTSFGLTPLKQ